MEKEVSFRAEAICHDNGKEYDIHISGSIADVIVDLGAILDGVIDELSEKTNRMVSYDSIKESVILAASGAKGYREKHEN